MIAAATASSPTATGAPPPVARAVAAREDLSSRVVSVDDAACLRHDGCARARDEVPRNDGIGRTGEGDGTPTGPDHEAVGATAAFLGSAPDAGRGAGVGGR